MARVPSKSRPEIEAEIIGAEDTLVSRDILARVADEVFRIRPEIAQLRTVQEQHEEEIAELKRDRKDSMRARAGRFEGVVGGVAKMGAAVVATVAALYLTQYMGCVPQRPATQQVEVAR